jgi:hypothetical protein
VDSTYLFTSGGTILPKKYVRVVESAPTLRAASGANSAVLAGESSSLLQQFELDDWPSTRNQLENQHHHRRYQ